jgi:molecular chaperone DnaK (HSP70)
MVFPGRVVSATDFEKIRLSENSHDHGISSAIAAFHEGEWIVGHDLEQRMNEIPEHKIISSFKLLLYDAHEKTKQAQRVRRQLLQAEQTLQDLLTATLAFVWKQVWKHIETEVLHSDHSYDDYQTLVYISVPKLATPKATKQLKTASKAAGLPRVRFVYEPLCAGACILDELVRKSTWFSRMPRFVSPFSPTRD